MKNINKIRERSFGQILVDEDLITQEHLDSVEEEQANTDCSLIEIILNNEYTTEWDLARSLVTNYQLPFLSSREYQINNEAKDLLPIEFLHEHQLYPLDVFGNILVVVTSGDIDEQAIMEIEKTTNKEVTLYIGLQSDIKHILDEHYPKEELASEVSSRMDELFGAS